MPVLKIEAEFEGSARKLFLAMSDLMRTFGHNSFQELQARSPLNIQVISEDQVQMDEHARLLASSLIDIGLRPQVYYKLERVGLTTVGDVVTKNSAELLAIPNFGKTYLGELVDTLKAVGLDLRQ